MLFRHKIIFWIFLALLLFGFFGWLFGLAIPEIKIEFALGTTFILLAGLICGNLLSKLWIRTDASPNIQGAVFLIIVFILGGLVSIALLLNAMIEETTLFRFAMTALLLFLVAAALGALVAIVRHHYKTRIMSAQAAMAQSKSELQLLQSRLSPHFLFNTLNNLYGLSMSEPERLPPLLLKLSELLRYSVYDVKEMFVPLSYEVEYIRNYVEFERIRLGERLQLTLDVDPGFDPACKIPPLMLIVFVENSFKHSRSPGEEAIRIDIRLLKREGRIVFSARNSVYKEGAEEQREKRSGFGLESVRRRLKTLYEGRHKLLIEQTQNEYGVYLELPCR